MCDSNPKIPYKGFGNYFNAGVLLVNAKKFRQDNIIEEYFKIVSTEIVSICDQDVLNRMFENNKFKKLDQVYNVIYQPSQQQLDKNKLNISSKIFLEASQNIVIRHYADAKPWNNIIETWSKQDLPDWEIYWEYAKESPFYDIIFNIFKTAIKNELKKTKKQFIIKMIKGYIIPNKRNKYWNKCAELSNNNKKI